MDRDLELNVHLLEKNVIEDLILKVNSTLEFSGLILGASSTLLLYDPEMEMDFDIEPVKDIENVVRRLTSWPMLGVVGYESGDYLVEVSFRKYKEADSIHCVSLSFPEEFYRNRQCLNDIRFMAIRLHEKLNAARTISDIEIESDTSGYSVDNEIELLRNKVIQGEYWLDIVNKSLYSIDNIKREKGLSIRILVNDVLIEREKVYITAV